MESFIYFSRSRLTAEFLCEVGTVFCEGSSYFFSHICFLFCFLLQKNCPTVINFKRFCFLWSGDDWKSGDEDGQGVGIVIRKRKDGKVKVYGLIFVHCMLPGIIHDILLWVPEVVWLSGSCSGLVREVMVWISVWVAAFSWDPLQDSTDQQQHWQGWNQFGLTRVFLSAPKYDWCTPLSHPSSCMLVNHGPSQQSSKEEFKP